MQLYERTGKRTLVAFDEFQALLSVDTGIDGLFRSRIQRHGDAASYVFAGSHPGLMAQLFGAHERPFFGQARSLRLDPLANADIVEHVGERFAATGKEVGQPIEPLLELAAGHPQRAMLLAHHLWEETPARGTAEGRALAGGGARDLRRTGRRAAGHLGLPGGQRTGRLHRSGDGEPVFGARAREQFNLSKGGAQHARKALAHAGHIQRSGDAWLPVDPLLAHWVINFQHNGGEDPDLMTARRRLVRVPASSANLGPGYDAMAAAVALHLELEVEETGEFAVETGGLEVSTGRDNLVVRAFETLHPADGIAFRLRSEIPLARGLGSSAAAIVAGLVAADHLFELALTREELLARATEIEGHPDNVAAAIYGGFVVCESRGRRSVRGTLRPAGGARGDRRHPRRGGLDPAGARGDPGRGAARPTPSPTSPPPRCWSWDCGAPTSTWSAAASTTRLHQPHRRSLYPRSMEIVDAAAETGALGATISGAGPTVLVWTTWEEAGGVAAALKERAEGWAEVRRLPFEPLGADVPEL